MGQDREADSMNAEDGQPIQDQTRNRCKSAAHCHLDLVG